MFSIDIKIKTDAPQRIQKMARAIRPPGPYLLDLGRHLQRRWIVGFKESRDKLKHAPAGRPPFKHTGSFSRSIVVNKEGSAAVRVGSTDERAALLQLGGRVQAKDKALAIPMHQRAAGRRPRDIAGLDYQYPFWRKGRLGNFRGFLVVRSGDKWTPYYALMREVQIRPHPWATITHKDWDYAGKRLEQLLG